MLPSVTLGNSIKGEECQFLFYFVLFLLRGLLPGLLKCDYIKN